MSPALARFELVPAAFNSALTQPLFTELANLLQNALFATGQIELQSTEAQFQGNRYRISKDFLYLPNLRMANTTIPHSALPESTNNPEEQIPC